jgi:hypothetical protein
MAIDFVNPITAGVTLIRSAIQSQNYVQGSTGWKVAQDGSAEFNNVTVRGTVTGSTINGGTITGSTITGSTLTAGTSPNPQVVISTSAQTGSIAFPSGQSFESAPSRITSGFTGSGSTASSQLHISGPTTTLNNSQIAIYIDSSFASGAGASVLQIVEPNNGNNQLMTIDTNSIQMFPSQVIMDSTVFVSGPVNITTTSSANYLTMKQSTDSFTRFSIDDNGKTWWGSGAAAQDTNLYRSATNTLKTDDSLVVGGTVTKSGATWRTPTMGTGWATGPGGGGAYPDLMYRLDAEDNLHLFGTFHTTTTTPSSPAVTGLPAVNQTTLGGVAVLGAIVRFQGAVGTLGGYVNNTGELRFGNSLTYAINDSFMVNAIIPLGNIP